MFDYAGETSNELSFKAGDIILVTESCDNGWLAAQLVRYSNILEIASFSTLIKCLRGINADMYPRGSLSESTERSVVFLL